jgi:ectoine hydroxylase-related dioxygenase (phytanoyl-CoA dioxygenase family)
VLRRFLHASELSPLRAAVDHVLTAPLPRGCERPHNTLTPLRWNDEIVERVLDSDRRANALVQAVGAEDLRWISAYVSVKNARSAALWWHQDWWCWDHQVSYRPSAVQVAVLCYLNDTTARNGALRVLPGTHHKSIALHAALPEAHAHDHSGVQYGHVAMRDHRDQVTFELRAGDAVVVDYRPLHGTHPNSSDERRDCLLLSFAPSWRSLPTDVRAHLIRHPSLPSGAERPDPLSWPVKLLPKFGGRPRDLHLNRAAPAEFEMLG